MIVTCPVCSAHYRVRDEVVPDDGAQLECPRCTTRFLAHLPLPGDADWPEALARLSHARRLAERERDEADTARRLAERQLADARAELELTRKTLSTRLEGLEDDLRDRDQRAERNRARIQELEGAERASAHELAHLRESLARATQRADREGEAERTAARLREELGGLQAQLAEQSRALAAMETLREEHRAAQKTAGRLASEVESAQELIGKLQIQLDQQRGAPARGDSTEATTALQAEIEGLRSALARCEGRANPDREIVALVASIAPMLWGLDQAIGHFEGPAVADQAGPGARDPDSAGHTRHLRLMAGMLKRLTATLITH